VSEFKVVRASLVLQYLFLIPFLLAVIFLIPNVLPSEEEISGKLFLCIWSAGVLFMVYYSLKMPYKIMLDRTRHTLGFSSMLSTKHVEIGRIRSIKVNINGTFVVFAHDTGKIRMINRIQDFHPVVSG